MIGFIIVIESILLLFGVLKIEYEEDQALSNLVDGVSGSFLLIFGLLIIAGVSDKKVVWLKISAVGMLAPQLGLVIQSFELMGRPGSTVKLALSSIIFTAMFYFVPVVCSLAEEIELEEQRKFLRASEVRRLKIRRRLTSLRVHVTAALSEPLLRVTGARGTPPGQGRRPLERSNSL